MIPAKRSRLRRRSHSVPVQAFDASFGLRRVCANPRNVELVRGSAKLRLLATSGGRREAVPIVIEGLRQAAASKVVSC